ncbi:DUF2285 domain-containing protein [Roseibium sp. M-1]
MFWSPAVDPSVLLFARRPDLLPSTALQPRGDIAAGRDSPDGRHAIESAIEAQLLLPHDVAFNDPLAALIPFDDDTLDRLDATSRLWRAWRGRVVPRDTRMTDDQRRRLRLKLQAADGRMNGASYREIAYAIFGRTRVAAEVWKTSSLRDAVIELVESGRDLIAGGYLQLLRHRRRR